MNNRKNQNSILVLATLGVYLGLVLVGATPQVWAQAATAKQFSVKDEIEVTDDLDKKPKDCTDLKNKADKRSFAYGGRIDALSEYADIIEALTRTFHSSRIDSYSLTASSYPSSDGPFFFRNGDAKPILFQKDGSNKIDEQLDRLFGIVPGAGTSNNLELSLEFHLTSTGLVATTTFNRIDELASYELFISLRAGLDLWRCSEDAAGLKTILANSEIQHKDSQVFIVTRLPRAGLDSLLATDAK